jgi:amino acid adenylation domain-containing protein
VTDVISDTLVAFCIPDSAYLNERDVQETCKKWLPPYMVPTDVLIMEKIPYLASGKVDRRALQHLHQQFRETQDISSDKDVDEETRKIAQIFYDVLRVNVMSAPSLSAAGVDSLSSIRIASQLRKHGYPQTNATDILEARSLSDLQTRLAASHSFQQDELSGASLLLDNRMQSVLVSHELLSSQMSNIQDIIACTPVQSAMLSETAKHPLAYCNWIELEVDLRRSIGDVEQAVRALTAHHEMLRTGFAVLNDAEYLYASVVWNIDACVSTVQVKELDREYSIHKDSQLLKPRPVQLRRSADGINLVFQLHHSLYDQWSIDVITDDLDRLLTGDGLSSNPSYATVAAFHARNKTQTESDVSQEYWQTLLHDAAATPLPQLNGQKVTNGLQRSSWLPLDISITSLRRRAIELNSSAPAIFQAAFAYVLSLYVGTSDVMYGTVFSGRHVPVAGVERIVGPCLATLPSRIDTKNTRSCKDLARAIHEQNRTTLKHSTTPLADVKRIGQYTPNEAMFDTLFVWQESTFEPPSMVMPVDSADQHELNMVLEVEPGSAKVAVRVTHQQSRITSEQVSMFAEQLQFVVEQIISDPQSLVEDLAASLPTHTLAIDNPHPTLHPLRNGLVAALEDVADRAPSAPALIFGESLFGATPTLQSLTYGDMHARANSLARYLLSRGVKPGDLVCVCMEKSIELYVTILGVLKAGAGYLPLLPDTPKERLISILDQTRPKVFLCDSSVSNDLRSSVDTEVIDLNKTDLVSFASEKLKLPYDGSHAAYSIFTSGSTGTPKGLVVTQDNLLGNLSALADIYPVSPGDRLLQACSQAFDVSVFEIFFAFFTGMPLCFARKDELFQDIEHGIRALEVTHLSLTPTVAALVDPKNVPSVRFLVTAGEAMTDVVHRRWAGNGLYQGYGPSETTNICTVNPHMPTTDIVSNIGPAFKNTSAFVIHPDKPFSLLPYGAVGELAFGGEQVFRGYIGRDELNAEKIVSHPEYGRVYRSGDIGRMLPGGTMLISGRLDDQVKVRGNRIELGEINATLLADTQIEDCTTLVLGKDAATQYIATFWIPTTAATDGFQVASPTEQLKLQIAELYEKLESSLPPYMIPTAMIPISTLPRTTQGKLDRRRLESVASALDDTAKQIYFRSSGQDQDDDMEWTPLERELASALGVIIGQSSTELHHSTSFFALGLNSINAIAYAKALGKRLNRVVSVGAVLRNASISRLARSLSSEAQPKDNKTFDLSTVFSRATVDDIRAKLAASHHNIEAVLPCTALQEAMLSADAAYSNRTKLKVNGDVDRLKKCLQTLVQRHAILRTRFYETFDAAHPFAQVILQDAAVPWATDDSLPGTDSVKGGNTSVIGRERPFSLSVETAGDDTFLVLNMHHVIYDGTSMSVLFEEAESLYQGQELPAVPNFAPFLREALNHSTSTALEFWTSTFSNFDAKPFPLRSGSDGNQAASGRITLPLQVLPSDVDKFVRRHNISATSLFQAAWAKVLTIAQLAGDVCFGAVVSGRSVPVAGVDRLVAPCFNTLPIRVSLDGINDNIGLVRSLHKQGLSSGPYQLTPLRRIQAQSRTPDVHLFDSLVLVQPPSQDLDQSIWEIREDEGLMDLPLVIEVSQGRVQSKLLVHYDGRYLSHDGASTLAQAFVSSLGDCLQFPSTDVRDTAKSSAQLLEGTLATNLVVDELSHADNDDTSSGETWTEAEEIVRQAFSHFANVDESKVRRNTSLYRLGLDSLSAVQVASRLRSKGMFMTAADVLEYRTPTAIAAAAIATSSVQEDTSSHIDLAKYDTDHRSTLLEPLNIPTSALESLRPCTSAQSGMLSQSMQSKGALYVNHVTYDVPKNVGEDEIRSAWREVQRKHQALRMGFVQTEEARCPFAMIVYHTNKVDVPLQNSSPDEAAISASLVDDMHLPVWQVTFDFTSQKRNMTLSIHHALYDAEGLQMLLHDLNLALDHRPLGVSASIDSALRPMLVGADSVQAEAEQFWRRALENSSVSPFPNLNSVVTTASDLYSVQKLSDMTYQALDSLCKKQGCTIQAAGQSAWALLLSSYLGEANVTFGTVFSGRTGSQSDNVVFPSLTTVPVSCNISENTSALLSDMTNFNGSAQRYKYVPLADIQRFANLPGQNLFDTVFVYQKSTSGNSVGLPWQLVKQSAAVDYNVSLELEAKSAGTISLSLTVNRGVVPEKHAQLLLDQYDHLLAQLLSEKPPSVASPSRLYSATPATHDSLPSPVQLLHQFVEQGAETWPDRQALEFVWTLDNTTKSRRTWSYRELNERANQVAHLILAQGAQPGDIIAVCMDKCPEASLAFIGVLKAGCAFLALDPELPQARKQFILKDSSASILFTDQVLETQEDPASTTVVTLRAEALDEFPNSPIDVGTIDPQATCYCLYTSGTTGTPKGCELTHENAVQAMMAFQKLFAGRWTPESRWLQFASYWFDVSVLEQFWSWSVGITLVGAPRDLVLDDIALFIRTLHITHIDLTPSLARILEPKDVPSLWNGVFITGGEALKQEIIEKWGSHKTICNGYGPTEATIGVTMNPFIGPEAKSSNIGPAFLNVGSYVFASGTTAPVLRGAVGELCVSGKLVGKGYLNRPELTAKAFPVLENSGEKIYRTGDLVRQLTDGSFLFIGRQDSQAKLRGQRLEIDEIDSVIKNSGDAVADYASLVIKGNDKETLVTFFITEVRKQTSDIFLDTSEHAKTAASIAHEACRSRLPGYMVPTHLLPVNIIPLTVNNKIDVKRLTGFFNSLSVTDLRKVKGTSSSAQPLGQNAKGICEILERMLSIDSSQMDRSTNIFSLGLSSVSVITFTSLLKRAGFANANVALIMRNPAIEQLSSALSQDDSKSHDDDSIQQAKMSVAAFDQRYRSLAASRLAMNFKDIEIVAPCTPLQQGLILESVKTEQSPYFNEFQFVADRLDVGRLRNAFQQVANLAQPLRTKFIQTDDGYAQVVLRRQTVPWYQYKHEPNSAPTEHRMQWLSRNQTDLHSPFELVVAQTSSKTLLTLHIHHALYDGISFDMMMARVSDAYNDSTIARSPGFIDALPCGPLRVMKDASVFWKEKLGGTSRKALPSATVGLPGTDPVETCSFGGGSSLDGICKSLGVSHQAVTQACFSVALHQFAPEVNTFGLVAAGRSFAFEGADQVLGPLFNTLPAPLSLQADDSWTSLIKRCHDFNVAALPYQHTPLRDIKKWCRRDPADPVFDAIFVFQNLRANGKEAADNIWIPLDDAPKAEYPLAFELELGISGKLTGTVVARRDVATGAILQHFLRSFDLALNSTGQNPQQRIACVFNIATTSTTTTSSVDDVDQRTPDLNGVHDFSWTTEAKKLRSEIAKLASLAESEVNENSTIFSLGLDSIDAVKLTSRLKKSGLIIPVSKLIRAQTIPRILSSLKQDAGGASAEKSETFCVQLERKLTETISLPSNLDRAQVERILPATPSQEALIAEMIRSEFREYYNHDVLRLAPNVDLERLQDAWKEVLHNTPILRTSFIEVASPDIDFVYAQVVHAPNNLQLTQLKVDDLTELDALLESIRDEAKQSFSVSSPTRLTFVQFASEVYLVLSLAHAQYDGHSLALIHQDVEHAYHEQSVEKRPSSDAVIEESITAVNDQALAFWRNNLSGARASPIPPMHADDTSNTLHRVESMSTITVKEARAFCRDGGVSLQSLAQSSWALTLAHYTRSLEVIFGAVLACRDSEEAEQVLFPMMNTVAMRATLHGTRQEMLKYMQDVNTDVLAYQRTPLRSIQRVAANVMRSDSANESGRLFDNLFIYQHRPDSTSQQIMPLYESVGGSSSIEYPVAVEMEAVGEQIVLRAACKHAVLDHSGAQELLQTLDRVLGSIIRAPNEPTVKFSGAQVSICGLPPTSLVSSTVNDGLDDARDESEEELSASSTEAAAIKSALSQVSRTPLEELSSTSTIESIGIDSISAIKVVSLLRKQGVQISVGELVRAKTIGRMAKIVQDRSTLPETDTTPSEDVVAQYGQQHKLGEVPSLHELAATSIQAVLPALPGQVYMLNAWQMTQGQLFYPTFDYRMTGDASEGQLESAWRALISKNDILRTVFCTTGAPEVPMVQVVLNQTPNNFTSGDQRPAVASKQPMAHLHATRAADGWTVQLSIHHALYDAISLPLLMEDFQTLVSGMTPASSPLSQADFLALSLKPSAQTSRENFWTSYLSKAKPLNLQQPASHQAQTRVEIFKPGLVPTTSTLETTARRENLTPQSILFAAHAGVYAKLARQTQPDTTNDDVVLGIYLAGRSYIENLPTLRSPTLNLVPLLVRDVSSTSLPDIAKQIQQDLQAIGSAENSGVGLWEIVAWTGLKVDTFVNFLRLPDATEEESENEHNNQKSPVNRLKAIDDERLAARSHIVDPRNDGDQNVSFQVPKELSTSEDQIQTQDVSMYLVSCSKALQCQYIFPRTQALTSLPLQHSLDLEATLTPAGTLDVGLFCPAAMLGLSEAEKALEELRTELEVFGA